MGVERNDDLFVFIAKNQFAVDTVFRKGRTEFLIMFAKLGQQRVIPLLLAVDCPSNQRNDGYGKRDPIKHGADFRGRMNVYQR
ncbi:hypothetical protein D3C86_1912300 [compost metagenome]